MTVKTMADHSGQVIIGRVEAVRSYWADNPRRIESEITFDQVEYLKGAHPGASNRRKLVVPGGTVGEMTMRLASAPKPKAGDKWMLCLLPSYKTHPVVGVWRGAFRIEADAAGIDRVYGSGGQPIEGVDSQGFVKLSNSRSHCANDRLTGSLGLRVSDRNDSNSTSNAIAATEFRKQLAPILAASKDHKLTEPAGRRVAITFTPVPMRGAAGQNGNALSASDASRSRRIREAVPRNIDAGLRRMSKP